MLRFKMAAKKRISFPKNSHVTILWKTTFPMEFLNELWLKVGEHEYIYIFEIKFEKRKLVWLYCEIMLIYANLRENGQPIWFFFTKRCVSDNKAITKKREENLYPFEGVLHLCALFLKTWCIFSKNKATLDNVSYGSGQKNVPRNSKITVYFSTDHCCEVTVIHVPK